MRKGQITIFIILGVAILAGAGFFFASKAKTASSELENADKIEAKDIKGLIDQCVALTAKKAVVSAGLNGGANEPSDYLDYFNQGQIRVPYYYGTPESYVPSEEEIASYLSAYMNSELVNCANFSLFPDYVVEAGKINTNITLTDKNAIFDVTYPLVVSKGGNVQKLSKFSSTVDSRIKILRTVAQEYIAEQMQSPEWMCISCLTQLSDKNKVVINTYLMNETVLYEIVDNSTKINKEPYSYLFAVMYPQKEAEETSK